jgi:dTDP-4-dehydrorhamnose reductase
LINTAGYVRVDDAESDMERCYRENTFGPMCLAKACKAHNVQLVTFSSDLVFAGDSRRPYIESDSVAPLNAYGRSKAEAEKLVLEIMPSALLVRTSAFFGPWDEYNFITSIIKRLRAGEPVDSMCDSVVSPTYVPDLVNACLDLLIDGEMGICHLANRGEITWASLARKVAAMAGLPQQLIRDVSRSGQGFRARRPAYCALASERFQVMAPLENAIESYFADRNRESGEMCASTQNLNAQIIGSA